MNCSRFRSQLRSLVESRSSLSTVRDGLRDHLTSCEDSGCREAWLELCLLEQAIEDWVVGFPQPELCDSVVTELQSSAAASPARGAATAAVISNARAQAIGTQASVEPGRHSASRWVVISVALLVLVSLIAILTSSQPPREGLGESGPVADVPDSDIAPGVADAPFAPPEGPLEEADLSSTCLGYAEDATQFLTDTVALTLVGEEDIEDPTAAADWIHQIEDELSPWGEDLDEALDQFLETLPDSET